LTGKGLLEYFFRMKFGNGTETTGMTPQKLFGANHNIPDTFLKIRSLQKDHILQVVV
jgi:hypothetical protein